MDVSRYSSVEVGVIKILILGDTSVGKTSIILRYTKDEFSGNHSQTMGIDFRSKNYFLDNEQFLLQI